MAVAGVSFSDRRLADAVSGVQIVAATAGP